MMRVATALMALLPVAAPAADGAVAEKEIAHLITHLGASGCEFNRNGSWYTSERAVAHLNKKYDYLRKRGLVPNAEAFIERAASESSISGKSYLVRCADGTAVPSAKWLRDELARYRAQPTSPPQVSVYHSRKHAWVQLPAGITTYAKDPS